MTTAWIDTYREIQERVVAHPAFRLLVRAVAVAEVTPRWGYRHTRNCPAYGYSFCLSYLTDDRAQAKRRALLLAERIGTDLNLDSRYEPTALAYGTARNAVQARSWTPFRTEV